MPLKRHPALQDLSRDHQLFMAEARQVRWFLEDDKRAKPLDDLIESLLVFWEEHGAPHCQEEETVIYPFYLKQAPLKQRQIDALYTDHRWLHEKVKELAALPRFENCSPLLRSMHDYIINHVRHEEHVIYDAIQDALNDEQLNELAALSLAYRQQNRHADNINRTQGYADLPDLADI